MTPRPALLYDASGMATESVQVEPGLEDIQPHVFRPEERQGHHVLAAKSLAPSGPCPLAIISDIHGNLEALTAVLADIDGRGIKRIICLGDVIGYGPNPLECIDAVIERCEFSLMWGTMILRFFLSHTILTRRRRMRRFGRARSLRGTRTSSGAIAGGGIWGRCRRG